MKRLYILIMLLSSVAAYAAAPVETQSESSMQTSVAGSLPDSIVTDSAGNVLRKYKRTDSKFAKPFYWIYNYLANSNKFPDKPYDGGFVFGPAYNVQTSFAIGGGYTALYSFDRNDPTLNKSILSSFFQVSVTGLAVVGVEGHNYMKGDKMRWNYETSFTYYPSRFWGKGYDNAINNDRGVDFKQFVYMLEFDWTWKLAKNLYIGPKLDLLYTNTFKHTDNAYGQSMEDILYQDFGEVLPQSIPTVGLGFDITYDSRDFAMNAYTGDYFRAQQLYYVPGINKYSFWSTDIKYNHYQPLWKKCTLALQGHVQMNYGPGIIPWTRLASFGFQGSMRGYFFKQYLDNNVIDAQVELRQRLIWRLGLVAWAGFGNVFNFDNFKWNHTLPNYGVGIRWEFKPRMNVRLDYGFTRDGGSFVFNFGEAF